jgi:streptomycin 3"-adenylyltransferase
LRCSRTASRGPLIEHPTIVAALPEPLPGVVTGLLADLRVTLGPELVGAYLYGSAIAGGFEPATSDLDVLVVTASPADATPIETFQGLIDRLARRESDWADRLDVAFVDRRSLATFRSGGALLSVSHDEPLRRWDSAADWLETWFLVRTANTPLVGPPPGAIIPPIDTSEFIGAVTDGVDGLIERLSADARPGPRAYLVLTLGRMLRTLDTGQTCSKQDGAAWIVAAHPAARRVVDDSLAIWRARGRTSFSPEAEVELPGLIGRLGGEIRERRWTPGGPRSTPGSPRSTPSSPRRPRAARGSGRRTGR